MRVPFSFSPGFNRVIGGSAASLTVSMVYFLVKKSENVETVGRKKIAHQSPG